MTNYESPVILRTEELAEGVYLASGCYTASAYIHQDTAVRKRGVPYPGERSTQCRSYERGADTDHFVQSSGNLHQFRRITGIR